MENQKHTHNTVIFDLEIWLVNAENKLRFFLGLVVIAQVKHPIPSRTRQLSTVAPMVLRLKAWESRSPPNLVRNAKRIISLSMTKT